MDWLRAVYQTQITILVRSANSGVTWVSLSSSVTTKLLKTYSNLKRINWTSYLTSSWNEVMSCSRVMTLQIGCEKSQAILSTRSPKVTLTKTLWVSTYWPLCNYHSHWTGTCIYQRSISLMTSPSWMLKIWCLSSNLVKWTSTSYHLKYNKWLRMVS